MNNNYYEWIKQCNQKAEIVSLGAGDEGDKIYLYAIYQSCRFRKTNRLKVKGQKEFQANDNYKKVGVTILISDKVHFKMMTVTRDNE